ncbi:hypothetical protein CEXT_727651 [Caerostris extrusa]|uniref:BTB domain-containing protein n=1 Tax=Caerostris extrusa TaxID=172846 RepID=A0AAV4TQY3_CAEEX|nr:hypothetical protein CEXT_727651 [Caerostris extrusa]
MVFTRTENNEEVSSGLREELHDYQNILGDLSTLYDLQILCDVHLKTRTESFPTHKAILCARSYVFRAMFTSDMREKNSDCIKVEDLDDDIVHRFLAFLYTDSVKDLQWETAIKLYYAGDKYEIELLKAECSSFLKDNTSSFNVMELLLLADRHQDLGLKTFAEEYILRMDDYIFGSDQWGLL